MKSSLSQALKVLQLQHLRRTEANRKFISPCEGQCAVPNWRPVDSFAQSDVEILIWDDAVRTFLAKLFAPSAAASRTAARFFSTITMKPLLFPIDWKSLQGGNGNSTSTSTVLAAGGRGKAKAKRPPWFNSLGVCLEKIAMLEIFKLTSFKVNGVDEIMINFFQVIKSHKVISLE